MRLHRLEITAFGPFPGTEVVDFDALGAAGLFLLNGPTGAGKTSVLDAICFALYGDVPGGRHGAREALRCQHAGDSAVPKVTLEASFGARRIRITRSPRHQRSKQRGHGLTDEQAKVTLERLTDENGWQATSTRLDEAGHEIGLLTGMTLDQFCQVVLLPQGEFATFLRAGAEERRPLLERLFSTHRFSEVETWFADRRTQLHRQAAAAESGVREVAARAVEATGELADAQPAPEPEDALGTWPRWLQAVQAAATGAAEAARETLQRAQERQRRARQTHDAASALAARQQRYQTGLEARAALDAQAPAQQERLQRLQQARAAEPVAVHLQLLDQRRESVVTAERLAKELRDDLRAAAPEIADDADARLLREQARAAREDLGRLQELDGLVSELAAWRQEIAALEAAEELAAEQRAAVQNERVMLPGQRESAAATLLEAQRAQAALAGQEQACAAHTERLAAARLRDRLQAEHVVLTASHERLRAAALEAKSAWLDLRERRLDGMAAELASGLRPGTPCPVCGSPEHPSPPGPAETQVTAGEEKHAGSVAEAAAAAEARASRELTDLASRLAAAAAQASDATVAELEGQRSLVRAERQRSQRLAAGLDACLVAVETLQRRADELADGDLRLRTEQAARRARLAAVTDQLAKGEAALRAALGSDRDPVSARARRERLADCCESLAEALADQAAALEETRHAEQAGLDAARAAGFHDTGEARAALLPPDGQQQLEAACDAHRTALAEADAVLSDPLLAEAAAGPAADPDAAAAELAGTDADVSQASGRAAVCARRVADLARLDADLTEALAAWAPVAEQHAVAERLANLVQGQGSDNARRMRLSAYVLAERLAQVAAAATHRLQRMSGGRYSLTHTTEGEGRGRRGGLGLRVVDAWSGQERDPGTLSGGESFLASLALALGLADVVGAEAGGAAIETLFIDEGFGTLDEDTLDEVMDTLDGLREGGRAVGIVSHVAELRQRIPTQLRVHKGRQGSTLDQDEPAA
jgi:exonuclease SbcC